AGRAALARGRPRPRGRPGRRARERPPSRDGRGALRALRRRERAAAMSETVVGAATEPLPIRRLHPDAILPARAYDGDAGLDLHPIEAVTLGPGERAQVGTGIAVAIPHGQAGLVLPRSGLAARSGIALVNAPGLIDAGYRGELRVLLLNTDRTTPC